jgi:hypothetical protein
MTKRRGPFRNCPPAFSDKPFPVSAGRIGLAPLFGWAGRHRVTPAKPGFRPQVEPLETRVLPHITLVNLQSFPATEQATATAVLATANFDTGVAGDYSVNIAWGDGSTTSGVLVNTTGNSFNIQGSHTYAEEGTFAIGLTAWGDGSTATAGTTATVADAPLTVTAIGFPVLEGQSISAAVATFSDAAGHPATYTASINWGDGTVTSGTVFNGAVSGLHSYVEEGTYTITVQVFDAGGATATAASSFTVLPAGLVPNSFNIAEG